MIHKAYIVNLRRCPEKHQHMKNEMARLHKDNCNLNYQFFDAIDGNDKSQTGKYKFHIPNWYDPNSGKAMTSGEVGCSLSHYAIWCDIVEKVESNAYPKNCRILILEDDVVFVDGFMTKFNEYHRDLTEKYDMLYLHRKPLNDKTEDNITANIKRASYSYWTCAYVVTYAGAKKLVNANFLNNLIPVDEFLPIMYGCRVNGFEKLYETAEKINCMAVSPSLLRLKTDSFTSSDTFLADSYEENPDFTYTENGVAHKFNILYFQNYINENEKDSRFQKYCKIYGQPVSCIQISDSDNFKTCLKNKLSLFENHQKTNTLVLAINANPFTCLPICSPSEIVRKYNQLIKNRCSVVFPRGTANNDDSQYCVLGYADNILAYLNQENNNFMLVEDTKCEIFLPLMLEDDITINTRACRVTYNKTKTTPGILFALGNSNIVINRIENYTGNGWNEYYGYRTPPAKIDTLPKVYLSFHYKSNRKILDLMEKIDYPRELLTTCVNRVGVKSTKMVTKLYPNEEAMYSRDILEFLKTDCEYYFFVDHFSVIDNPKVLHDLLALNKSVVAPFICKPNSAWSNFWGDLDNRGFYKRSFDYMNIVEGKQRACWNMPYINGVYLIKRTVLERIGDIFTNNATTDIDMRFCQNLRENGISMYITNLAAYGYIEESSPEPVDVAEELTMYDLFTRRDEWEKKYLHPKYYENRNNLQSLPYKELVTDIYNFPLFSDDFCHEMIATMERFGQWSKGEKDANDSRLGVGYIENVPTVDQHMFQISFDKHWSEIVMKYVAPVASMLYSRYKTKGVHLGFVVRYKYDGGQRALPPHHDASTYTINVALNRGGGVDYSGGGSRFIRQNFVTTNQEMGTANIHAGRLVAYHEGIAITGGTRYILVSFIN